jgi:hypothetical protein
MCGGATRSPREFVAEAKSRSQPVCDLGTSRPAWVPCSERSEVHEALEGTNENVLSVARDQPKELRLLLEGELAYREDEVPQIEECSEPSFVADPQVKTDSKWFGH